MKQYFSLIFIRLLIITILLSFACNKDDYSVLEKTTWLYIGFSTGNEDGFTPAKIEAVLTFINGGASGQAKGEYFNLGKCQTYRNGVIKFFDNISFTDKGNVNPEVEKFAFDIFNKVDRYNFCNDTLYLLHKDNDIIKLFVKKSAHENI